MYNMYMWLGFFCSSRADAMSNLHHNTCNVQIQADVTINPSTSENIVPAVDAKRHTWSVSQGLSQLTKCNIQSYDDLPYFPWYIPTIKKTIPQCQARTPRGDPSVGKLRARGKEEGEHLVHV